MSPLQIQKLAAMSRFAEAVNKHLTYQEAEREWATNGLDLRAARALAMEAWGRAHLLLTEAFNRVMFQTEPEG